MRLTNEIIYNSIPAVLKLKEALLPIKTSYKISRNTKILLDKASFIEEQRVELVKKYGTKFDDGTYRITPINIEIFEKEYCELLSIEEDVDIQMIHIDELEDIKLSPSELDKIFFLIDTKELS